MDNGTHRNILELKRVTWRNVAFRSGIDSITDREAFRENDVSFLAVSVMYQGNSSVPVGVILDGSDFSRNAELFALEIDNAVSSSVSASDVAHGDTTCVIAAAMLTELNDERAFWFVCRNIFSALNAHMTASGRIRLELFNGHNAS